GRRLWWRFGGGECTCRSGDRRGPARCNRKDHAAASDEPGVRADPFEGLTQRHTGWDMTSDHSLLEALLDSWDRNNRILVNLLRAVPEGGLEIRAMQGSPSVGEMFTHIHYVRLVFVAEDAPEFARELPKGEWVAERDP